MSVTGIKYFNNIIQFNPNDPNTQYASKDKAVAEAYQIAIANAAQSVIEYMGNQKITKSESELINRFVIQLTHMHNNFHENEYPGFRSEIQKIQFLLQNKNESDFELVYESLINYEEYKINITEGLDKNSDSLNKRIKVILDFFNELIKNKNTKNIKGTDLNKLLIALHIIQKQIEKHSVLDSSIFNSFENVRKELISTRKQYEDLFLQTIIYDIQNLNANSESFMSEVTSIIKIINQQNHKDELRCVVSVLLLFADPGILKISKSDCKYINLISKEIFFVQNKFEKYYYDVMLNKGIEKNIIAVLSDVDRNCIPKKAVENFLSQITADVICVYSENQPIELSFFKLLLNTIKKINENDLLLTKTTKELIDDYVNNEHINELNERFWFKNNYEYCVQNYNQALDIHGNLKNGVCLSNAFYRSSILLKNECVDSRNIPMGSNATTRFHQNIYIMNKNLNIHGGKLIWTLDGITDENTLRTILENYDSNNIKFMTSIANQYSIEYLHENNKMFNEIEEIESYSDAKNIKTFLIIMSKSRNDGDGHAINIQLDKKNNKFRFFDDNFGSFEYHDIDEYKNSLNSFLHTFYPSRKMWFCPLTLQKNIQLKNSTRIIQNH